MKKKLLIIPFLIFIGFHSYSQWTRVQQLPSTDIASLYHKDSILYAGGKNVIYYSRDRGQTWDSTSSIPNFFLVTSIIVYRNELYAAAPNRGVFKSPDGGITWQDISSGIFPDVSDFCEFRGDLYAATLGNSVYKLNAVTGNSWSAFNNGLSSLSANINAIAGNNNALIAGTNANGLYDYLPANSANWEERFLRGQISPSEGVYDIINAHDSLFITGHSGRVYISTDNGLHWSIFGDVLPSLNSTLVNAKQALILSRVVFDGTDFISVFYYIKKDSLQNPFVQSSFLLNSFTYKIDIIGNKLWNASDKGLFFMSLSDLPGITEANDSIDNIPLPVLFTFLNTNCEQNKIRITWKTSQEINSDHFDIERTHDNINWTVIGSVQATGNSSSETSYSFTDNDPVPDMLYRITEYDINWRAYHTGLIGTSCNVPEKIKIWPNPIRDMVYINIVAENQSQVSVNLFDSKGSLIRSQKDNVMRGSTLFHIYTGSFPSGVYYLSLEWGSGLQKKVIQLVKQ
jgi:hypothetical protein